MLTATPHPTGSPSPQPQQQPPPQVAGITPFTLLHQDPAFQLYQAPHPHGHYRIGLHLGSPDQSPTFLHTAELSNHQVRQLTTQPITLWDAITLASEGRWVLRETVDGIGPLAVDFSKPPVARCSLQPLAGSYARSK